MTEFWFSLSSCSFSIPLSPMLTHHLASNAAYRCHFQGFEISALLYCGHYTRAIHFQTPRIFILRKNGRIVSSWILFERAGHTDLLKLWGVCRRNGKIVTQVPFPGSASKVTKWEQQCPAALKSQRERVKFKTWIAPLFSLCIICQSRVKSAFCPPAASPRVHISITWWCTFLWNSAGKINDFTFLSRIGRLFSHFFFFFYFLFNLIV